MKKKHIQNNKVKFMPKVLFNSIVIPAIFYFTGYLKITLVLMSLNTFVYTLLLPLIFFGRMEEVEDKVINFIFIFAFIYIPILVFFSYIGQI
jgi:hypothetical protein